MNKPDNNAEAAVAAMDVLRPILQIVVDKAGNPKAQQQFNDALKALSEEEIRMIAVLRNICEDVGLVDAIRKLRLDQASHLDRTNLRS